jgi:hypothetical protein
MRRDYFDLAVENIDWVQEDDEPEKPLVQIDFHGPDGLLEDQLIGTNEEILDAEETDVALRLQDPTENQSGHIGVVGVTNRVTGDFILELNQEAEDVLTFITAAREYGQSGDDDGQYRVEISVEDDELVAYDKSTFLVYDSDGNLLRSDSLIPSGVEL